MELTEREYKALEDIVGTEYISKDLAIRDTYNQVWGNKLVFGEKWSPRPVAVLLPGNTEEVQAIVKVCNRYGIQFKPFSSGFEITAIGLASEKGIMLDLKRMDRILEIDVKNMHAVVEPYVSVHRLQLEVAKYGLYYGAVAAGPSAGVIASSCFGCRVGAAYRRNNKTWHCSKRGWMVFRRRTGVKLEGGPQRSLWRKWRPWGDYQGERKALPLVWAFGAGTLGGNTGTESGQEGTGSI
jgi:FAD/FMN-containing dehydrogenase